MRINKASEAILAKYSPPPKLEIAPFFKSIAPKKRKPTLEEFYQELSKRSNLVVEQVYNNKNAQEIESMMVQNRKLIEAKRFNKK
ncbi:MAG: hypothetical protein AB7U44_01485 [Sulfuricurvum sp.]|jgi:hypothetical protein|uniref:hypothetical protein n=1 Tax=Sulfuricurvum sp. TaxID=2025608 RepID=UPI00260DE1AC|nr:hypothetical protein [Sulfuricurvum sp.]MDD2838195.1 hypothetical protein [Sulfuricurvum sp.]MDD3595511.1 hypothetical protein [Sulfuricurvum sp.]MDD4885051.1 hypothetical protein [Sulfuricurvum sp.]